MVSRVLGALRLHLGRELDLIDQSSWRFLWVTDFPMFEWDPELERWDAVHHPFTRPNAGERGAARHRSRARRRRSPTTSSGTASSSPAARSGSTSPSCRPRCSGCSTSRPEEQRDEVRLPARRARDGRAAARRDRLGHRPALDDAARRAVHPRHASRSRRTRPASTRCRARRRRSRSRSSTSSGSP